MGFWPRIAAAFIVTVALAAGLVTSSRLGLLPDGPDEWTVDWRTWLLSPRAARTRSDIAVLAITETTLAKYPHGRTIDRNLLTELINGLQRAEPKIIGLDVIFDREVRPDIDARLIQAIKSSKAPIVLGAIDGRARRVTPHHLAYQEKFIVSTGRQAGHLFFQRNDAPLTLGDQVVRYMADASPLPPRRRAFSELLAVQAGSVKKPASPYIAWLKPPNTRGAQTFLTLPVREHMPVDGTGSGESIFPPEWSSLLRDRIVLIGADFLDRDQHLTPLSIMNRARMPGVLIHAQVVAQLTDGRSLKVLQPLQEFILLFFVGLLAYWLGLTCRLHRFETVIQATSFVVLILVGALLFSSFNLIIPATTIFFAWLGGLAWARYCDVLYSWLSWWRTRPKGGG